jgi:hypothetical protein
MKASYLCVAIAATLALASCEIPRKPSAPDPITQPATPEPAPVTPPRTIKVVKQAAADQHDIRSVDGRRAAPLSIFDDAGPANRSIKYRYGNTPAPMRPQPGTVRITATLPIANETAASKTRVGSPIVVIPQRPLVEQQLIGKGAEVLDRTSLALLESEHFIQRAAATRQDMETWTKANNAAQQGPSHVKVLGRDAAKVDGASLWILGEKDAKPLLNGSALAEAAKLPAGQMQAARSILAVSDTVYRTREVGMLGNRPTADSISFTPSIRGVGPESLPQALGGQWHAQADDPFHYVLQDGPIYFDAERRVFWRVGDAWVGREVTRQDFLRSRSKPLQVVCAKCGHVHASSNPDRPNPAEHPEQWQCPECDDRMPVKYLDGYHHPSNRTAAMQLTVQAQQTEAKPGLYPVATATTTDWDLLAGACIAGEAPEQGDVAARLRQLRVLPEPAAWCWLDADGTCLVIGSAEWSQLRHSTDAAIWPIPVVDADGKQQFRLLSATHVADKVSIQVERAEVEIRITSVATGQLLVVGTVAADYLNLLTQSIDLPIYKSGPQLQDWPTIVQQRRLLDKELARRIAELATR